MISIYISDSVIRGWALYSYYLICKRVINHWHSYKLLKLLKTTSNYIDLRWRVDILLENQCQLHISTLSQWSQIVDHDLINIFIWLMLKLEFINFIQIIHDMMCCCFIVITIVGAWLSSESMSRSRFLKLN